MRTDKQRPLDDQKLIDDGFLEGVKSFDHQWKQILKHFNWEKVYTVMKALDWGWSVKGSDELYIPSVDALKIVAYRLLKEAYEKQYNHYASGGFVCGFDKDGNFLWITFQVAEWAAED